MKKDIHPKLSPVLFCDTSGENAMFLIYSSMTSKEKVILDVNGENIECYRITISSSSKSHPFYAGEHGTWADSENKIKGFNNKFAMFTS